MHFSLDFFILLFSVVFENGLCQRYEGDACIFPSTGANGVCKLISLCPSAILALQTQGIYPTNCGFKNNEPIICCADGGSTSSITTTSRSVTISTARVTPLPTQRIPTTPTIRNVNLQVGDISKQKCREYGTYVYEETLISGLPGGIPLPRTESCPVINVENIVGGENAKPKEFPHMALVGFDGDDDKIHWDCGGSLISEKFVLSAAHCTFHPGYLVDAKYILLGELELDSSRDDARPQQISIRNTIVHPNYRPPSHYNDIALFELVREATLNTYARPACLNTNPSLTNTLGIASGWGKIATTGPVSKKLQKVTLEMFTNAECNFTYRNNIGASLANGIVEETQLCAGSHDESKDTCQGDSGGPLQIIGKEVFCSYNIIGITSFGKQCGVAKYPGVYTRVSAYIKWIEDIVWP